MTNSIGTVYQLRIAPPITGERNYRLVLLGMDGQFGEFRCDCGNMAREKLSRVRKGAKKSCGCLKRAPRPNKGKGKAFSWLATNAGYQGQECLIWPFARDGGGYGQLINDGKRCGAHRLMCALANGSPPAGAIVNAAHECGNGHLGCVSPRHLVWKTKSENEADRVKHGTDSRGEKCVKSVMTAAQVIEARARARNGESISEVARSMHLCVNTVYSAVIGRTWAWLDPDTIRKCRRDRDTSLDRAKAATE